jgi:hypothetical protein
MEALLYLSTKCFSMALSQLEDYAQKKVAAFEIRQKGSRNQSLGYVNSVIVS